jgi:cephalosporin-C deacetylase
MQARATHLFLSISRIVFVLFVFGLFNAIQLTAKVFEPIPIDSVLIRILPVDKKAEFGKKKPLKYRATIKNLFKRDQEGVLTYTIKDVKNKTVATNSLDVKVAAKKTLESSFEIPFQRDGSFQIEFVVTTADYSGSLSSAFTFNETKENKKKEEKRKKDGLPFESTNTVENLHAIGSQDDIPESMGAGEDAGHEAENNEPEGEEEEGEILTTIKPIKKDGIFWEGNKIEYTVTLENKYKIKQEGSLHYFLLSDKGEPIADKSVEVRLPKKGKKTFKILIPPVEDPGIYTVSVALNLTTYDDTTKYAFGYEINKIKTPYHKPPDFDEFWDKAKADLAAVDPQYNIELDKDLTTPFHKVYRVEMMSLESVKIFGWLTIPRLPKKFPVIIGMQGYRVELEPLKYDNFVGFNLNTRGIAKNWKPFNPDNEQPLLVNILDKEKYIYRGIYMDCVRALDFIFSHEKMGFDLSRVLVFGGSQGATLALVTAALTGNKINSLIVDNPIFADFHESYKLLGNKLYDNFPIKHVIDYAAENPPLTTENLLENLSYFELQNFMPNVKCSVLYAVSLLDPLAPAATCIAAYNKMSPLTIDKSEMYVAPDLGHEVTLMHRYYQLVWMNEKLVRKRKNIGK